ncbi:MAG: PHP domain-containing protein [Anaerolineales bacterium]|nr:PHP domain-containing protein [Anaerolineales bacterium]
MTYEYVGNLHLHTAYSDGHVSHEEIALAAIKAGIDFVVVTDHNVWVGGMDGYRTLGNKRVLLLVGEEVHDQIREPQKNHLLIYETGKELSQRARDPQELINAVNQFGGFAFLAHPTDPVAPAFDQPDLSWVDWDIEGYTGLELWNYMSEFKSHLSSFVKALYYAFNPSRIATGPFPQAIKRWDSLLSDGRRVVAIGGADAHAFPVKVGPINRILFPFEFHFQTVNTHVLLEEPLIGDVEIDRRRIFNAIRSGHCFVGYDLPASTRGFRFTAAGEEGMGMMGDRFISRFGVTLQVKLPQRTSLHLIRNGHKIGEWHDQENVIYTATDPGAYRIEAFIEFKGKQRGWIYSNPIYISTSPPDNV